MTARKKAEPETSLEMPAEGGSYIRQEDGSLKRVEFTDHAPADAETAADTDQAADTAPQQEA